jgi:hypothetical protein
MGTPLYTLRLPQKVQEDLSVMAKVYGLPNGRAFLREVAEVMTGGDLERVKGFNARLCKGMGEQMALDFNQALDVAAEGKKQVQKPRKKAKRGKGAPSHERRA